MLVQTEAKYTKIKKMCRAFLNASLVSHISCSLMEIRIQSQIFWAEWFKMEAWHGKTERAGFFHWQFLNKCSDKSHGGALGQGNEEKVLREEGYSALETDTSPV